MLTLLGGAPALLLPRVPAGKPQGIAAAIPQHKSPVPSAPSSSTTSAVPADSGGCESVFLCKTCSQLFGAAKGLEGHACGRGEQQQVTREGQGGSKTCPKHPGVGAGLLKVALGSPKPCSWRVPGPKSLFFFQRSSLGVAGTAQTGTSGSPSEPAAPPLVIPVSVPVPAGSQVGPGALNFWGSPKILDGLK